MKTYFLIFAILLGVKASHAQTSELINYNWNENRARYTLTPEEEALPVVILLNKNCIEYIYEKNGLVEYAVEHTILRVNSDDAIEGTNKISVPMMNTMEVVNIKARSISKEGKIINLDKSNIKEVKEDEEESASKIFAIEGVEKGSEIEYFYIRKMQPMIYGSDIAQFSAPTKEVYFQLISPENLEFKFKAYNGYPEFSDTVIHEKNIYTAHKINIPGLENETSCNYRRNQARMEFKLAYNTQKGRKEFYTWNEIAQYQHDNMMNFNPKEIKALEKLYGNLNLKPASDLETKIRAIENYVKSNFVVQEIYKEEDNLLDNIIKNRVTNKSGLVKLFAGLFKIAEVDNMLVLTSERDNIIFDGNFESWRFLNDYLFYFPATDRYLTPVEDNFRYPLIPYNQTFTQGLFFKTMKLGDYESFIPQVKFIQPLDYKSSGHNIDANIEFINNNNEIRLSLTCAFSGYFGAFTQPYYSRIADDKKEKMLQDLVKDMTKDTKFISLTAENTDPNTDITQVPFKVHAVTEGSSLIEIAGNKILLKIGEVIGKQVEMYQEKKRVMEVEDEYNRGFFRTITVKIPEGYTIKNPEDVRMNHVVKKGDQVSYQFISTYTMEGNLMHIDLAEYYNEITCPVEMFEQYRAVVNAAADFNKVTLILEQK